MSAPTSSSSISSSPSLTILKPPAEYTRTTSQRQKIQRIYEQQLQNAIQRCELYMRAGIGAGISITWALLEPQSFLSGLSALASGFLLGNVLGFPGAIYERSQFPSLPRGSSQLETIDQDDFQSVTDYLTAKEFVHMPLSRSLKYLTYITRTKLKHLNLANLPINDEGLLQAIRLHPGITHLTIAHCPQITFVGIAQLGQALRSKALQSLTINLPHFDCSEEGYPYCRAMNVEWINFLLDLNLSKMESLEFALLSEPDSANFWYQLARKVLASHLKKIKVVWETSPFLPFSVENSKAYLQILPTTLEHLDLEWLELNDELADILLEKFDKKVICSCTLTFSDEASPGGIISEEKIQKIIDFLPLHQMSKISLQGGWSSMTSSIIDSMAPRLVSNHQLETLSIACPARPVTAHSFLVLLQSLRSPKLHTLHLRPIFEDNDFLAKAFLKYVLLQQSIFWTTSSDKISCDIHCLDVRDTLSALKSTPPTLSEAQALFQAEAALLAEMNQAKENVLEELLLKQQLLESFKNHFRHKPIQTILAHYAALHNALDPDHRIKPDQIREYYGQIPNSQEDLRNLPALELITCLEELHQMELQQIEAAEAAALQPLDLGRRQRLQDLLYRQHTTECLGR